MIYRRDIDGLRALAILPVVFFHAGIGIFSGGFIGVDVFFVISGFLITGVIVSEIRAGTFSLASFYERRVRRLFPALAIVLLASTVVAAWIFLPQAFREFGKSLTSTVLFYANIYFRRNQGYFAPDNESQPLLHMWSLGVEEQFYILFPFILLIAIRFGINLRILLTGAMVVSLVASIWALPDYPRNVFYLLHFRAWELLIGAILAFGYIPAFSSQRARDLSALTGLAMIIGSVLVISNATPFPGLAAIPPCLGAALIIHAGSGAESCVGRFLGLRPIVFIGLISYPLYLWHWPVLVFTKYYVDQYMMRDLTNAEVALSLFLAFLAAILTWRFVETPIRKRVVFPRRWSIFSGACALVILVAAIGLIAKNSNGMPFRWPPEVAMLASGAFDFDKQRSSCENPSRDRVERDAVCMVGDESAKTLSFAIIGDSHAAAIAPAVGVGARSVGRKGVVLTADGCPPLLEVNTVWNGVAGDKCAKFHALITTHLNKRSDLRTVFVISRWFPQRTGLYFADAQSHGLSNEESKAAFYRGLERMIVALKGKRIILSEPIPEYTYNVPSRLAIAAYTGSPAPSMSRSDFMLAKEFQFSMLKSLAAVHGFETVDLASVFCSDIECVTSRGGRSLYSDDDHPSLYAADLMGSLFIKTFMSEPNFANGKR